MVSEALMNFEWFSYTKYCMLLSSSWISDVCVWGGGGVGENKWYGYGYREVCVELEKGVQRVWVQGSKCVCRGYGYRVVSVCVEGMGIG